MYEDTHLKEEENYILGARAREECMSHPPPPPALPLSEVFNFRTGCDSGKTGQNEYPPPPKKMNRPHTIMVIMKEHVTYNRHFKVRYTVSVIIVVAVCTLQLQL